MTTLIDLMMAGMIGKKNTPNPIVKPPAEIVEPYNPGMTSEQLSNFIAQVEPSIMEECCPDEFWNNENKT